MTLKPEDAALFYELFMPLLNYVNHHYHVTEDIDFTGKSVDAAKAMEVARFLWKRPSIIDDYINLHCTDKVFRVEQRQKQFIEQRCVFRRECHLQSSKA